MSKSKSKKAGSRRKGAKGGKPFVYVEVSLPATQSLRIVRSSGKRDVPSLKKLEAAAKKSSGCGYELVVPKALTVCLKPAARAGLALRTVAAEDAMFEAETTTTTPTNPGGGGGG